MAEREWKEHTTNKPELIERSIKMIELKTKLFHGYHQQQQ